jgi:capsular polysaccharide biosynthesis protein
VLAGIVVAFGFSLAVGFMLELADPVAVSSDHVETAFGLPVLGSVDRIC